MSQVDALKVLEKRERPDRGGRGRSGGFKGGGRGGFSGGRSPRGGQRSRNSGAAGRSWDR
jgi:hypothetical protein